MSIFLSELGQIVFYVANYFLLFAAGAVGSVRRGKTSLKAEPSKAQRFSSRFNGLLLILGPLIAASFGYSGIGLLPDWAYYLGLSFSILSTVIWFWGQQTLGRYYSHEAVIYQGHQLVERGPYRFVRHPIYTGGLLLFAGMGLMAQSWVAVVLIFVTTVVVLRYRIAVEEKILIAEFGEQYISYSKRVKRFIPFIF